VAVCIYTSAPLGENCGVWRTALKASKKQCALGHTLLLASKKRVNNAMKASPCWLGPALPTFAPPFACAKIEGELKITALLYIKSALKQKPAQKRIKQPVRLEQGNCSPLLISKERAGFCHINSSF